MMARVFVEDNRANAILAIPPKKAHSKDWCPKELRIGGAFVGVLKRQGVIRPAGQDKEGKLWMRGPNWTSLADELKKIMGVES